jgi:hypothetical protein
VDGPALQRLPGLLPPVAVARWRGALATRPGGSLKLAEALPLHEVLHTLEALPGLVAQRLGAAPRLLASQCWVRRAQPPHHWHQDGALHFDFLAHGGPPPPDALLTMLTCWIPLDDCGADAPGLEWLPASPARLLQPQELGNAALRARFGASASEHPALAAGEALLFDGALLHRTHWRPTMTRPRTSIELRFVAANTLPQRLARETLLPIR